MSHQILTTVPVCELAQGMTVCIGGALETVEIKYVNKKESLYKGRRFPKGITRVQFRVPTINGFRITE